MPKGLTRYLTSSASCVRHPFCLSWLDPRPGTPLPRLPERMAPLLCLGVYKDPLKEGRGTGFRIEFLENTLKLQKQHCNQSPPPLPSPSFPPEKSVTETHRLLVSGQHLTSPQPLLPGAQRWCTNQERVIATVHKGGENPISFRGARHTGGI